VTSGDGSAFTDGHEPVALLHANRRIVGVALGLRIVPVKLTEVVPVWVETGKLKQPCCRLVMVGHRKWATVDGELDVPIRLGTVIVVKLIL
jgi:hypothetical protein